MNNRNKPFFFLYQTMGFMQIIVYIILKHNGLWIYFSHSFYCIIIVYIGEKNIKFAILKLSHFPILFQWYTEWVNEKRNLDACGTKHQANWNISSNDSWHLSQSGLSFIHFIQRERLIHECYRIKMKIYLFRFSFGNWISEW